MQTQSHLLYKTRCPKCAESGKDRSGDNLGVYSDRHTYCFSCGYGSSASLSAKLGERSGRVLKDIPDYPEDVDSKMSDEAYTWLSQYFPNGNFPFYLWSESTQRLYFPLDNGAYQYRNFRSSPKWIGYGINENLTYIVNPSSGYVASGCITLVEDLVSGWKVGHITPTLVLFGSNISLTRLAKLKQMGYDSVNIWLDWDKNEYAIKVAKKAQEIGLHSRVIHSKLDPKDYDYETIKYTLEERIYHETS